jgi:hypothetical protein
VRTQAIHKGIRELFLSDTDLFDLFGGRLSNTRLPSGMARPYITIEIDRNVNEIYTGGQIADYIILMKMYATEGVDAQPLMDSIGRILDLVQILNVEGAKKIVMVNTSGTDDVAPEIDLGHDVLVCSLTWNLKLFEPNRLSPPNGEE